MTKYLISFPSEAMVLAPEDFAQAGIDSRAVIEEAKAAGVYVFGGGISEAVAPVLVSADGSVSPEIYPGSDLTGGFCVLEVPTREEAVEWARKIAASCRCAQNCANSCTIRRVRPPWPPPARATCARSTSASRAHSRRSQRRRTPE
ncbi:YciI family protein [Sphingomonas immobilis]|uniref:Transcription initiation protein n=1 Tax=Sphingomonas immobilis TaxID=3063997 RepID=A0ABT9A3E6_9SPHN|nr:hypothetical protein [Sphingomonas sp. CA1-15]MDO7844366.1 hypothetical protein [Sphingomonas sp. CA1-15]